MTSNDLASRTLAAIEAREKRARAATPGPWAPDEGEDPYDDEVYTVHDGEHGDLVGEVVAFVRGGDRQHANQLHIAHNHPDAVLRACATDRRRLERHTPIPDHGRFSDDWARECPNPGDCDCGERPKVCGACRDQVGDPLEAPCPDLLDLADSCGVAPEGNAGHRVDPSGEEAT